jgi:hypothetical protein
MAPQERPLPGTRTTERNQLWTSISLAHQRTHLPKKSLAKLSARKAPAGAGNTPETRTTGRLATVANTKPSACSANAHPSAEEQRLAKLEESYRHELMDEDERQELRDRVLALRRRLGL